MNPDFCHRLVRRQGAGHYSLAAVMTQLPLRVASAETLSLTARSALVC